MVTTKESIGTTNHCQRDNRQYHRRMCNISLGMHPHNHQGEWQFKIGEQKRIPNVSVWAPIQLQQQAKLAEIARTTRESLALSPCFPDPPRLARVRWKLKQIVIVVELSRDGRPGKARDIGIPLVI